MATTRYHRWVVMASAIKLLTSWTPTLLAVSKPKVGAPPGSGRSLSMVFGTCATRRPPPAAPASRDAENAVSSPPMVTSASIPSFCSDSRQACSLQSGSAASLSRTVGLAREVRRIDPPWTWILDTSVMESGRTSSIRPSMRCWNPSTIPTTSHPEFRASIVAAEMTEFIPGAGPPPHKIPSFTPPSSQPRGDPDKRWDGSLRLWFGFQVPLHAGPDRRCRAPSGRADHRGGQPAGTLRPDDPRPADPGSAGHRVEGQRPGDVRLRHRGAGGQPGGPAVAGQLGAHLGRRPDGLHGR